MLHLEPALEISYQFLITCAQNVLILIIQITKNESSSRNTKSSKLPRYLNCILIDLLYVCFMQELPM